MDDSSNQKLYSPINFNDGLRMWDWVLDDWTNIDLILLSKLRSRFVYRTLLFLLLTVSWIGGSIIMSTMRLKNLRGLEMAEIKQLALRITLTYIGCENGRWTSLAVAGSCRHGDLLEAPNEQVNSGTTVYNPVEYYSLSRLTTDSSLGTSLPGS